MKYDTYFYRADQKNVIHVSHNVVPFVLKKGNYSIEVLDPISAELLDLDTVYNQFENSTLSVMDHIIGFFNGVRQRGIETTEELLKEGTHLTGNWISLVMDFSQLFTYKFNNFILQLLGKSQLIPVVIFRCLLHHVVTLII